MTMLLRFKKTKKKPTHPPTSPRDLVYSIKHFGRICKINYVFALIMYLRQYNTSVHNNVQFISFYTNIKKKKSLHWNSAQVFWESKRSTPPTLWIELNQKVFRYTPIITSTRSCIALMNDRQTISHYNTSLHPLNIKTHPVTSCIVEPGQCLHCSIHRLHFTKF